MLSGSHPLLSSGSVSVSTSVSVSHFWSKTMKTKSETETETEERRAVNDYSSNVVKIHRGGIPTMDPVSRPWTTAAIDTRERERTFIRAAYGWMFGGLLLTAAAAAWVVM